MKFEASEGLGTNGNRPGYEDLSRMPSAVQFHRERRCSEDCCYYAPQAMTAEIESFAMKI